MSNKVLLVLLVAAGCTAGLVLGMGQRVMLPLAKSRQVAQLHRVPSLPTSAPHETAEPRPHRRVVLYVATERGDDYALASTTQRVSAATPEAALRQLLRFPKQRGGLFATLPPGTKLRRLTVSDDGTADVDFSREFVANFPGGSEWEAIVLYSVVDTLTQFDSIKRVRFLVEGQPISDLGGHVDLSEPLGRDTGGVQVTP